MDSQESIKDRPKPCEPAAASASAAEVTPMMALVEAPKSAAPGVEPPTPAPATIAEPKIETAAADAPKIELASIEAPHIAPGLDEPRPPDAAAEAPAENAPRVSRFTLLAASLALAAALGGMGGALAAYALVRPAPALAVAGAKTGLEEVQALKENIVQARVELAALKVSIDSGIRNASAQFTRLGERIERMERVQAEPAAKLSKAVETLDRLARSEATGSIAPPQPAAAATPANAGVIEGWVVRDVHRGTALIEGRMGLIEVDKGDVVPGLGRVDAIRKQDGRWVVVTSKGTILSPR